MRWWQSPLPRMASERLRYGWRRRTRSTICCESTFGPSGTAQRERPRLPTSLAPHRVSDPFDRLHALGQDDPAAREGCAEASSSGAEEDPEGGLDELMLPQIGRASCRERVADSVDV